MHTHQRQIDTGLYPTEHPFDIVLIVVLVSGTEEPTCVVSPPGDTCGLHAETRRDLTAERFPVVAHITAPQGRTVTLDARETATGEDHRFLACLHQTFIDSLVHQQRIDVTHQFARPAPIIHTPSDQVIILRLCGILPPGINTEGNQSLVEVLPIGSRRLWVEEVNPVGTGDIIVAGHHLPTHL